MFPNRATDLPRPSLPGSAPPPGDGSPGRSFAKPPSCPRCDLIDHQTKLQLNTFQKVYRKKLDEAQHNAGRWKSEYYQMREQLYQQQAKRRVWSQLPAVVAGCVIGLCIKSPPAQQAVGWLLTRLQQVNPWPALKNKLQAGAKRAPPAGTSSAAGSSEDTSKHPSAGAAAAAAAEAAEAAEAAGAAEAAEAEAEAEAATPGECADAPATAPPDSSDAPNGAPGGPPDSSPGEVPVAALGETAAGDVSERQQGDEATTQ